MTVTMIIDRAGLGVRLSATEAMTLAEATDLHALMHAAAALRDIGHGQLVSYSRKVFIPLTQLCRDVCHYCTFAHPPRRGERAYLTRDEVLDNEVPLELWSAANAIHDKELRKRFLKTALLSLRHKG